MNVRQEYRPAYQTSLVDSAEFWARAATAIDWDVPPTQVLDATSRPTVTWFPDARLNTSFNALDRHVYPRSAQHRSRADQPALIYDSPVAGAGSVHTYAELLAEVSRFAGALTRLGVSSGDRVVIYLPMIPEAVIAMLACARIGAVHSVVFGGFAAPELAARITDAEPVLIVTASGGLEPGKKIDYPPIVQRALELADTAAPHTVIVKQRAQFDPVPFVSAPAATEHLSSPEQSMGVQWLDWDDVVRTATPADPVSVAATDPLYILYTSGTTGKPKGVVRDNGGHAVALAWSMRNVYNVEPGQVMWAASDVGWVVGHSYIVYAPLLVGATTVLYEGKPVGTPDAGAFWRVVAQYKVDVLFTAPTALRAIRKADPSAQLAHSYDLSTLRALFCAGERLDPATFAWAVDTLLAQHPDCPVVDHWWQTETGWPICANPLGLQQLPIKAGSASVPVPGYRVRVLDSSGNPVASNTEGNIVVGLPLPPGAFTGLWRDDARYQRSYLSAYPGHYLTGDYGYLDEDGYLFVLGRSDDVINMAGHRLSAGSIEAAIAAHDMVAECAVIGLPDELKGHRPLAYAVLKSGVEVDPEQLRDELAERVRSQVGAIATLHDAIVVSALPKTRSGKILRKTIREITTGVAFEIPSTIDDPTVLATLEQEIRAARPHWLEPAADDLPNSDEAATDGDPVAPS
ncbi:AMP-binding protein [Nocardia sp. CNY236]|uniref:AMP-binding protein n=1 Tax=Nocardia sp. CNY236 TaxID=1169152 RepID=UPI00048CC39F|nr:AMP-binding protein [Nocardia sp. CNY236]